MIDIHRIIYLHLAEVLNVRYDEASPELGVMVAGHYAHGTKFQWRMVVEEGRLQLELHRTNQSSSAVLVVASAELSDPGSLDPETILGLKDTAVNQAESVAAKCLLRLSEHVTA